MSSTPETAAAETAETTTTTTAAPAPAPVPAETTGCDYDPLDDLDLPPLRIRATRHGDRLSASSLNIPPGIQASAQKRYSLDSKAPQLATASPTGVGSLASSIASVRRGRSRSRSPSLRAKEQRSLTAADGNSSLSSLEEFVDPDILYDKMGFVELEGTSKGHSSFGDNHQNTRAINLTPVSERMSEDTLEDVHAFSDLSANTNTRPSSSVGTGGSTVGGEVSSHILEPLDEGDEELESDDDHVDGADHHEHRQPSQVILTNLEKITLDEAAEDELDEDDEEEEGKA